MTRVQIDPVTVQRLDLGSAAIAEAARPAWLLPRGTADDVLGARAAEFADLLAATLTKGLEVQKPEIVLAAKASRGRRPVAVLSAWERTLYRAAVDGMAPMLPPVHRSNELYEEFRRAPLDDPFIDYIVLADIASCYQYMDYGILRGELVASCGEAPMADVAIDLLRALSGHEFGLPQNRHSSDILAEAVLDLVGRKLERTGLDIWRYNDDFRLGAIDRQAAHTALEQLETDLRQFGFVLNDEKTSVMQRERYEAWVDAVRHRMAAVGAIVDIDIEAFTEYGVPLLTDEEQHDAATALTLLQVWQEGVQQGAHTRYGPDAVVERSILSRALGILAAAPVSEGLGYCSDILDQDPSLTPDVAKYMVAAMETFEHDVDAVFADLLPASPDRYLSPWQCVWLCEPLRFSTGLLQGQIEWLTSCLDSPLGFLRAAAAEVVGKHRILRPSVLARQFDDAPVGSRPKWVTAIAASAQDLEDSTLTMVTRGRPFYQWVAEATLS